MPRVKRNKPNFGARGPIVIDNNMTINHFVPIVKRNEDLYSFVSVKKCVLQKMFFHVSSLKDIEKFTLDRYLYRGEELVKVAYELKQGMNPFDDGNTALDEGDIVRFDISGIDSVYGNVGSITIGILLSTRVNI